MIKNQIWIFLALIGFLWSCSASKQEKEIKNTTSTFIPQELTLNDGWLLQANDKLTGQRGDILSSPKANVEGWYETSVPTTILNALVKRGVYKDPYFANNMSKIPAEQFQQSWWYRREIDLSDLKKDEFFSLKFDGINYSANIWLNGKLVAEASKVSGVFNLYNFDITDKVRRGKNILAIEVFPPKAGDFTIGFVDWAPVPQDKNMGIWREVRIKRTHNVSMNNTFVHSDLNVETLDEATLTVSTELTNNTKKPVTGVVKGRIEELNFSKEYTLAAGETKKVVITAEDASGLVIKNPRVWWPNGLGNPEMYKLFLTTDATGQISDANSINFGIRKFEDYFIDNGKHRGYKVNGKEFLIKGGGWVDDLLLANDTRYNEAQVEYTKHMGLNTIRFEGFWGTSQEIYDLCDKHGLLAMVGFSCQWEWRAYIGGDSFDEEDNAIGGAIDTSEEINLVASYFNDMTIWLRNHPSVFAWTGGSDRLHPADLEKKYLDIIKNENPGALFLGAAKMHTSKVTGNTGVKMYGPYDYVPPVYWYTDTAKGGNYGFNTETGPGPQPPVAASLKKMLPKENWWPIDTVQWNYHCGRHAFGDMHRYLEPLHARYGKPNSLDEFAQLAQIQNYELLRPMFEAFILNKPKSTGIVQWMLNSAWPETYWQLYDYYLYPTGAFYGTKVANQPILIAYNYGDKAVYVANETYENYNDLTAKVTVYDSQSKIINTVEKEIVLEPYKVMKITDVVPVNDPNKLYFVDLEVVNGTGEKVSENFYWLSTKDDEMKFEEASWIYTPTKEHGDMTYIMSLPEAEVNMTYEVDKTQKNNVTVKVTIENLSDNISFFNELTLVGTNGEAILPVFWSDNYISLAPKEKKVITAKMNKKEVQAQEVRVIYTGFNSKQAKAQ